MKLGCSGNVYVSVIIKFIVNIYGKTPILYLFRLGMVGNDWEWLGIVENDWEWLGMVASVVFQKWLKYTES